MRSWLQSSMLITAFTLLNVGCDGMLPDQREVVYFSSIELDKPKAVEIVDNGPRLPQAQKEMYAPIISGFEKNWEELLRREDIKPQLERIENVYVATGRYLELVSIYQKDVAKHGAASPVRARLAWGYVRLQQQNKGRELIDQLLADEPGNASVHFLDGAYWMQWDPKSPEAQRKVIASWEKALAINPNYRGYEGIGAAEMRTQIQRIQSQLPPGEPIQAPKPLSAMELAMERVRQAPRVAAAMTNALARAEKASAPAETPTPAPAEERAAPAATPEPAETAPAKPEAPQDTGRQYRLLVAKGELLLSQNKHREAEDMFLSAQSLDPSGFDAIFGQLRAGWGSESARNKVASRVRALAKRDNLSPRATYEIGLFAYSKMGDSDLARTMLERAKTADPALAERVGIDTILSKL